VLAKVALAAVMFVLVAGCEDGSGQVEAPDPKTVVVTSEMTVREKPLTVVQTVEVPVTVEVTGIPSSSNGSTSQAADVTCEIGQECDLGESSVTVTSAEQVQSVNAMSETLEGNFVVIEFDYTHGGDTATDLGEPPFKLLDGEGNTYSLNFDATSSYGIENDRSLIYETVQPGVSAQGTAIFEVASEATDFTLIIADLVAPQANSVAEVPLPL
jgi:hypothetical protein